MRIRRQQLEQIIAHAREEAPNECCGMVASNDGEVTRVFRTANVEESPFRFVIGPQEQLEVLNEIERERDELGAIYHSHTRTEPTPSQTDINFARAWPGVLWIIVGLRDAEPEVRTWAIAHDRASEVELTVE